MDAMDLRQKQYDLGRMSQQCRSKGIQYFHSEVTDEDEEIYSDQLFKAAIQLYDLIDNKKLKVFLHDKTGTSRVPTLLICYKTLFLKSNLPIKEMVKELKKEYPTATPNMEIIVKVLQDNKSFLEQQRQKYLEEERNRKRLEEEEKMRLALQAARDELERLRKLR